MALGLRAVIDAMPCDCGRNVVKLAELSRRSGIHIVAPTGLHHERYYGPDHWSVREPVDGHRRAIHARHHRRHRRQRLRRPDVRRTAHRAGVIKIAGSQGGPSDRDRRIFEAAAATHLATGAPILTHCEGGTGALEQVRVLADLGVAPSTRRAEPRRQGRRSRLPPGTARDRRVRRVRRLLPLGRRAERHAAAARMGARGRPHRWHPARHGCGTQGYYHAYGGSPGLAWLLDGFAAQMRERGIDDAVQRSLFVDNPARAFAFEPVRRGRDRHDRAHPSGRPTRRPAHERRRLARAAVVVRGRDRGRRARRVRPGRPRGDARRRVDLALRDQERAGIDVVSDGEMRRAGFFTAEFYRHLTGVRALPSDRLLGAGGHDQQHRFDVLEPIAAPDGLGVVEEFRFASHADRRARSRSRSRGPTRCPDVWPTGPARSTATATTRPRRSCRSCARSSRGWPRPAPRSSRSTTRRRRSTRRRRRTSRRCSTLGRAGRRAGPARGAPVLRELPRPAARAPDVPAGPRRDARVPGRRARSGVRQPRDGRGGDPWRDHRGRTRRRGGRRRREELPPRIGRRGRGADRPGPRGGRPAGALALVPDCGFSQTARWATTAKLRALVAGRDLVLGRRG